MAETTRLAYAPNMMTATYQVFFHEPVRKQLKGEFPRMLSRRSSGYDALRIGWGCERLISCIHCAEKSSNVIPWGAQDCSDVRFKSERVYHEMKLIATVLSRSHPMDIANPLTQGVFVWAFVAPDGILLICINERVKSLPEKFVSATITDAEVEVLPPPWLTVKVAAMVSSEGDFVPLLLRLIERGVRVRLPQLKIANIVLLAPRDELLRQLRNRYQKLQQLRASAFLAATQKEQEQRAMRFSLIRKIPAHFQQYAVVSQTQGCYGVERKSMWNPSKEKWIAWEWYDPFGNETNLLIFDGSGQLKDKLSVRADMEGVYAWRLRLEALSNYKLVITPLTWKR